jgi:hypothetical protein
MRKKILLSLSLIISMAFSVTAQESVGYTTTDVGGEFQWHSPGGYSGMLHVAFNGEIHSGFQVRAGYMIADRKDWGEHVIEKGGGPGGGLGYRYYFPYRPHQFFLGIRSEIWRLKIDWEDALLKGTTKTWTIQPAAEAGYMILINDMAFITPAVSAGYFSNLSTDGAAIGEGFVFSAGISIGLKF